MCYRNARNTLTSPTNYKTENKDNNYFATNLFQPNCPRINEGNENYLFGYAVKQSVPTIITINCEL